MNIKLKNAITVPLLLLAFFMAACNNNGDINDNSASSEVVNNNEAATDSITEPKEEKKIIIQPTNVGLITFDYYDGNKYARLVTHLNIENNSQDKFTDLKVGGFLEIQFKGEKVSFIPWASSEESGIRQIGNWISWNDDYGAVFLNRKHQVDMKHPWLPGEVIPVKINIPYSKTEKGAGVFQLSIKDFQRTPEAFNLIIVYKAISVNEELHNYEGYNILDQWIDLQKKLGLR